MTTTTQTLGTHTAAIEVPVGTTSLEILQAIHDWVTTHGWVDEDSANGFWTVSGWTHRVYSAVNADGVSKKYVAVAVNDTDTQCQFMATDNYDPTTKTFGLIAYGSNDGTGALTQRGGLITYGGVIYLTASNFWMASQVVLNNSTEGSVYGSAWMGCFETTVANSEDDPTIYCPAVWANGWLFSGNSRDGSDTNNALDYQNVLSPINTHNGGASINMSFYTRIITPFGSWGNEPFYGTQPAHKYSYLMPTSTNPFNSNYNVFDVSCSFDNVNGLQYVKGKLYGLKCMSTGVGQVGDIMKVKVDSDFFCDPLGTLTDHIILAARGADNTRVCIPM